MSENHKDPTTPDEEELVTKDKEQRPGLMKILGKAIGLDITTISIPVTYNEPTSFLQRMMEYLTYSELLDKVRFFLLSNTSYHALFYFSFAFCVGRSELPPLIHHHLSSVQLIRQRPL
jgi:hypothetical protein